MIVLKIIYHIFAIIQNITLKLLYGKRLKIGNKTTWRKGFSLMISKEGKVNIGENCFFNNYCSINANEEIIIGKDTILGENVKIYDHNHKFREENIKIKEQGYTTKPISIGENCWIGSNVTVLKGAVIEDNCVIGAGNVIDFKVPRNTLVKKKNSCTFVKIREDR